MPPLRRRALLAAVPAAAVTLAPRVRPARAATFPDRPIRLVVPFAPGGNADLTARIVAPRMAERLGQPIVVENRAGAGGSVGAAAVARSRADGYTLMIGSNGPLTVNPHVQANLPYDPVRDFALIGLIVRTPQTIVVHRALPPRSVAELIAYARANPGRVGIGTSGVGSMSHLALEVFNAATGAGLVHVPFGSGGAMTPALVSGTVSGAITEISTALPLHHEGATRILAVTSTRRLAVLPDIPTVAEAGVPGYRAAAFLGIVAPAGVPAEVVAALRTALAAALADATVRQRFEEAGSELATAEEATPEGFAAFLRQEIEWTRAAAERAGLKPG